MMYWGGGVSLSSLHKVEAGERNVDGQIVKAGGMNC